MLYGSINYQRGSPESRRILYSDLRRSNEAVHLWTDPHFLPLNLTESETECEACMGYPDDPWWYNTDMIGHSITLPLTEDSMRNLIAGGDIDPTRVVEVLEASQNREEGIFKEISHLHPTRRLEVVTLCWDCINDQYFAAWVEELCQLWDLVDALEERILLEKQLHDVRWRHLNAEPEKLKECRFCDIPWPVRRPESIISPSQLSKTEVRRFLFSRCIIVDYFEGNSQIFPEDILTMYRQRWSLEFFQSQLPWICQKVPSFLVEQAAILEGVALIRQYLDDFERENWEVILGNDPSYAQWKYSSVYQLRPMAIGTRRRYQPQKWPRVDTKPESRGSLLGLSACLVTETILFTGFLRAVQST